MTDTAVSIDQKMLIFDKYLERSNMDKKQYQYDGVAWCLRNEIQPLKKVDPNLLLGKEDFAPLFGKVDRGGSGLLPTRWDLVRLLQ